ncbi:MAG: transporter substrate-binding domain-containing protein [Oleispira sp.]|nr:transporter substrate-binding domain-containing protein [Oleispira sp.]
MIRLKTLASTLVAAMIYISNLTHADNLIIGVENIDYFPIYQYSNGQYSGAASEILNKFATLNNHTVTYKGYPITRLNKNYLNGTVGFRFPDNAYWAQDQKSGYDIQYSASVIDFIDGVMVSPSNKGRGIEKFKKLGLVRGFTAWDYLDLVKKGSVKIKEANSLDSLIKLTSSNRYDGAYFNVDVATYYLNNTLKAPGSLVFDPDLPHTKSSYSLSSFKHPKIIEQFNQFLIEQADWIKTIKEKYHVK